MHLVCPVPSVLFIRPRIVNIWHRVGAVRTKCQDVGMLLISRDGLHVATAIGWMVRQSSSVLNHWQSGLFCGISSSPGCVSQLGLEG